MPDIVGISATISCGESDGGVLRSFAVRRSYITNITVDVNGQITNFTMSTAGKWKQYNPTLDSTSFYNETGQRNGNSVSFQQEAFLKFEGQTNPMRNEANELKSNCHVWIHVGANGARRVQGIEVDSTYTSGFSPDSKRQPTRVIPSNLSDTGDNTARLELSIQGESQMLSPFTTLTDAAILAL